MSKISMKRGLKNNFLALEQKDPNTIYFLNDTGEVYLGDKNMSQTNKVYRSTTTITPEQIGVTLTSYTDASVGDLALLDVLLLYVLPSTI